MRTELAIKGPGGASVPLIDGDVPSFTRTAPQKMSWQSSDTTHLRFDNCRVPASWSFY